jgi:hypothetical protein
MGIDAVKADAAGTPDGVVVSFVTEDATFDVVVPPVARWKSSATRALRGGDFLTWAEIVLSDDDAAAVLEADPTNGEFGDFFDAWQHASGEDLGKAPTSRHSSRSTRKR